MNTKEVQEHLIVIGWPLVADGSFGTNTKQAVEDFQRGWAFYPLLPDGFAAPQTQQALSECVRNGGKCAAFFKFKEFKSKGDGWIKVHSSLGYALDRVRERYGSVTLRSGYRDPIHNRKQGGKPNSQHLYGNAADISAGLGMTLNACRNLGLFSGIGVQRASGVVVHVDVRHVGPNTTCGTPQDPTLWYYG